MPKEQVSAAVESSEAMLPAAYRILPERIPFYAPGFVGQSRSTDFVLAPERTECSRWFMQFADRAIGAVGNSFFPVCRMSDGEFMVLFGDRPPNLMYPLGKRLFLSCRQALRRIRRRFRGFQAMTVPGVSSGSMTYAEYVSLRPILSDAYARISTKGILGIHLSYGKTPFQEQFFPAVREWLDRYAIELTLRNYVPFYFVYALLRGERFSELVGGRRVLVVHSAAGSKREAIIASLRRERAASVEWLPISPSRSFADVLDLSVVDTQPHVCLVGAGVGKAMILKQLEPLAVPCIDAGYAFEVWADADKQWDRPYMTPDRSLDVSRVRFLSAAEGMTLAAAKGPSTALFARKPALS